MTEEKGVEVEMNLIEDLKKAGVTIPEEIEKKYSGDFVSKMEMEKKLKNAEDNNKDLTERLNQATNSLKDFENKDYDGILKQLKDAQESYNNLVKAQEEQAAERNKTDLLNEAFSKYEFTSEAAKKSIFAEVAKEITVKDGALFGFDDLIKSMQTKDAGAFKSEAEKTKAKFTEPMGNHNNPNGKLTKTDLIKQLGAIKSPAERQRIIGENMALFTEDSATN